MKESFNIQQYQRQVILPGMGVSGQQKLLDAKVLVIGAGGLGCPALQYLVAAGVGNIGIIDGDVVDLSNLHRQILFGPGDIGKSKALTAAAVLLKQNPACRIYPYNNFFEKSNAFELIEAYDIIIDGSDNFSTRYLANDICVLLKKPLVYGAIYRFEGQVAVFNSRLEDDSYSSQYRDIFPVPPTQIPNCAEAGVLGVLPGIIGTMQAAEVIKLLTGIGRPLINSLLSYNALTNESYLLGIEPTAEGTISLPKSKDAILNGNYEFDCNFNATFYEITAVEFNEMMRADDIELVDVREFNEFPQIESFKHVKLPLSNFQPEQIKSEKIVLFCQSGTRSKIAAKKILQTFPLKKVYSLKGGIVEWFNYQESHTNGA